MTALGLLLLPGLFVSSPIAGWAADLMSTGNHESQAATVIRVLLVWGGAVAITRMWWFNWFPKAARWYWRSLRTPAGGARRMNPQSEVPPNDEMQRTRHG
jgi:hypothetical protein